MGFFSNLFGRKESDGFSTTAEEGGRGLNLTPDIQVAIAFGATLVIGLCCAMTVVVPRLRPSAAPPVQPTIAVPDYNVPTAREAYAPAVELIRQTDPGAMLASGVGAWTPNIDSIQLEAGRTGWTFHFYLPASNEMATVIVDRNKVAHISEIQPWTVPPALLSDQGWQVDSPEAISRLLEACQGTLREAPDAQVQARLSTAADNRLLMWQVRVFSPANPLLTCEVGIDAMTGLVR